MMEHLESKKGKEKLERRVRENDRKCLNLGIIFKAKQNKRSAGCQTKCRAPQTKAASSILAGFLNTSSLGIWSCFAVYQIKRMLKLKNNLLEIIYILVLLV